MNFVQQTTLSQFSLPCSSMVCLRNNGRSTVAFILAGQHVGVHINFLGNTSIPLFISQAMPTVFIPATLLTLPTRHSITLCQKHACIGDEYSTFSYKYSFPFFGIPYALVMYYFTTVSCVEPADVLWGIIYLNVCQSINRVNKRVRAVDHQRLSFFNFTWCSLKAIRQCLVTQGK